MFARYRPTQRWSAVIRRVCFYGLVLPATLLGTVACKDILVDFPPPGQGCEDGDLHDIRCGINGAGAQRQECTASVWIDVGPCSDPDVCVNGDEKQEECGENLLGRVTYVCERGQWTDSDECVVPPTDTPCDDGEHRHLPCGLNDEGLLLQECVADAWQDVGQCSGHDVCKNGDSSLQACGADGLGLADSLCENGQWTKIGDCHLAADDIAVGAEHMCLLSKDKKVYCWGVSLAGEVGTEAELAQLAPAFVPVPGTVSKIVAGEFFTCALTLEGEVYCWGDNRYTTLGQPQSTSASHIPLRLENIVAGTDTAAVDLFRGIGHTCALLENGRLQCWGRSSNGRLGAAIDPMDENAYMGVSAPFLGLANATVRSVSVGEQQTCAIVNDGEVWCWGIDYRSGSIDLPPGTYQVIPDVDQTPLSAVHISTSSVRTCAITSDGRTVCWGSDYLGDGQNGVRKGVAEALLPVDTQDPIVQLAVGDEGVCALRSLGRTYCWGDNFHGEMGQPSDVDIVYTPTALETSLSPFRKLDYLHDTPCAITIDDRIACWGRNERLLMTITFTPHSNIYSPVYLPYE